MYKTAKEYRETLETEDIKNILRKFDVEPVREYNNMLIYPTVNHNLEGGSPKLYYYTKNKMFKCYTGEGKVFDIFQLIIDMHNLRGKEITLREAMSFCGIDTNEPLEDNEYYGIKKQLDYLYKLNEDGENEEPEELVEYPLSILNKYIFDNEPFKTWTNEGISIDTIRKYKIKYDPIQNAIVIPYFSEDDKLVGVRGRFLSPDAYAKYMPLKHNGKFLVHPTSKIFYGLNVNKEEISKQQTVIIFEGEKSVMKMDTIYGKNNISVAVSGRAITNDHLNLLLKYDVKNVIIAFDRDYKSIKEIEQELENFKNLLTYASNFFNISIILDYDFILEHKNSPIDQGKEIFNQLMEKKIFL